MKVSEILADKINALPSEYSKESDKAITLGLKQPPSKIIDFLEKRTKNLKVSVNWDDLDKFAQNKAFTVAKVLNADILQTIADDLNTAVKESKPLKQFQAELIPKLEKSGYTGLTPARIALIYDTNVSMAHAQGKIKQQKLLANIYPFWKYTQINRDTKDLEHEKLDGLVFRHDDPIWGSAYPPGRHGCDCSVVALKAKDAGKISKGSDFKLPDDSFNISPFAPFEPDTTKYVSGIKKGLDDLLKQQPAKVAQKDVDDLIKIPTAEIPEVEITDRKISEFTVVDFDTIQKQAEDYYKDNKEVAFAFDRYSSNVYKTINNSLRFGGKKLDKRVQGTVDDMNKNFKLELEKDSKVFRGISFTMDNPDTAKQQLDFWNNLKDGKIKTYNEKSFMSTTTDKSVAEGFRDFEKGTKGFKDHRNIVFDIGLAKGTGVGVGTFDDFSEKEIILSADSQFDVVAVKEGKGKDKNTLFVSLILKDK